MSFAGTRRSVFAPITALSFSADQLEDCRTFLARRSEHTEIVPISDAEQLIMGADGRLVETGYRFNYFGFAALTAAMVTGVGATFKELAGEVVKRRKDTCVVNLPAAVNIYNTVVRSQIEQLRERSLLVDHRERVVDGFLGLDYRLLANSSFIDIVQNEITSRQPTARFYRAELVGRELSLYYIDPNSRVNDIIDDPQHVFLRGWYFANGEGTNKAIHATCCVYTKFGVALEPKPTKQDFLQHSGADLAGRAAILIGRTASREINMATIAAHVLKLTKLPLGFVEKTEGFQAAVEKWADYLRRFRIPGEDAKLIAKNAALIGSDITPRDPVDVYRDSVLQKRTGYDLLCALLRFSRSATRVDRARYQHTAMKLMYPAQKKRARK